jgi:hypothetical protein
VWVFLVRLIYEFGGTSASLFGGIALFIRYCKEGEDSIVCFLRKVFDDLAR